MKISRQISVEYKELPYTHHLVLTTFCHACFLSAPSLHSYILFFHYHTSKFLNIRYINLFWAHFVAVVIKWNLLHFGMHNIEFSIFLYSHTLVLFPWLWCGAAWLCGFASRSSIKLHSRFRLWVQSPEDLIVAEASASWLVN